MIGRKSNIPPYRRDDRNGGGGREVVLKVVGRVENFGFDTFLIGRRSTYACGIVQQRKE